MPIETSETVAFIEMRQTLNILVVCVTHIEKNINLIMDS